MMVPGHSRGQRLLRYERRPWFEHQKLSLGSFSEGFLGGGPKTRESTTGPWANDGSSTMAQQAKAVEEEDAQTAPGGLY